jgi:hypothetical protein
MESNFCNVDERTEGWTDRQTDMTKLLVAFRNFANAPILAIREHSTLVILDEKGYLYIFGHRIFFGEK